MLIIALCAAGGGILAALLGWADSHEPFDGRKFIKSVGVAIFSGISLALMYSSTDVIGPRDYLLAFASGSGVDVLANRAWGTVHKP